VEPSAADTSADGDPGFVKISNRKILHFSAPLHPADAALQNPPDGWNAVPEAASAALGLVGMLMLLLRRRVKSVAKAPEKP
jgi:MYXO-CTERM domain-containing protein